MTNKNKNIKSRIKRIENRLGIGEKLTNTLTSDEFFMVRPFPPNSQYSNSDTSFYALLDMQIKNERWWGIFYNPSNQRRWTFLPTPRPLRKTVCRFHEQHAKYGQYLRLSS